MFILPCWFYLHVSLVKHFFVQPQTCCRPLVCRRRLPLKWLYHLKRLCSLRGPECMFNTLYQRCWCRYILMSLFSNCYFRKQSHVISLWIFESVSIFTEWPLPYFSSVTAKILKLKILELFKQFSANWTMITINHFRATVAQPFFPLF